MASTTTTTMPSTDTNNLLAEAYEGNKTTNDTVTRYFYQVEQVTFLWVLFTLIVIGNSTVLIALSLSKGRKSRMNFFIKNLAAADLCVGLISVLTDIIWRITISWEAGLIACKIIRFLQVLVTYASTYVLVALSIDRYDAITHPMNFSGSWKRARALVVIAWTLSAIFSMPILFLYETTETPEFGTQCWIDFTEDWHWKVYMTLVSLTIFIVPAVLIAGCYIVIVVTIWSKSKEMSGGTGVLTNNNECNGNNDSSCEVLIKKKKRRRRKTRKKENGECCERKHAPVEDLESRRASSRGLIPKAKVKTVKMTFVIIFVFILCWSPYIVFDLLQVYELIPNTRTTSAIATFIQSLAPLNSAANPIIYCLFSTNAGQSICAFFACGSRPCRGRGHGQDSLAGEGWRGHRRWVREGQLVASHNTAQTTKSTTLTTQSSEAAADREKANITRDHSAKSLTRATASVTFSNGDKSSDAMLICRADVTKV